MVNLIETFDPGHKVKGNFSEQTVAFWISTIIKGQKMLFIDIGSYAGEYTELANLLLDKDSEIYSFDPKPKNEYGAIEIALGDEEKSCFVNEGGFIVNEETNKKVLVKRFDDIFEFTNQNIFVKIDVEGYELKVLKGMIKLIEENHPIFMIEIHYKFIENYGAKTIDVINFLLERGYDFVQINSDARLGHFMFSYSEI